MKAGLGEHAGVVGRGLLFDGGPRVAYDDGGAGAVKGVGDWVVEVSSEFDVAGEEGDVLGGRGGAHCCIVYWVGLFLSGGGMGFA
jgi:hypothetical protein